MIAQENTVVSFEYTLTNPDGEVLDSSEGKDPLTYLHGAGNIIPGLEVAIAGKSAGDSLSVVVAPSDGYGERDDRQVANVPKENFAGIPNLEIGMPLEAQTPQGPRVVRIAAINDDSVTIDANHPLAGVTLHFDVRITDVRQATPDEISHGHAHGPGGHDH
ncbi:MAG: peptidylprolyl isomerase [Pirellulaceae bacterium]|nr:peptidylprolyl isomerase [Planctomycetales bacterium]